MTPDGYADDVLVLPGPRRPVYPGVTLVAAPTAAPTLPPPAPTATAPTVPTVSTPAPIATAPGLPTLAQSGSPDDTSDGDVLILPGPRLPPLNGISGVPAPEVRPSTSAQTPSAPDGYSSAEVGMELTTETPYTLFSLPIGPLPPGGRTVPANPQSKQGQGTKAQVSTGVSRKVAAPQQPITLFGLKVSVSLQAAATFTWSKGTGKVAVSFDPKSGSISMRDGPLTVTDPGHLQRAASGSQHFSVLSFLQELAQPKPTKGPIVPPGKRSPTVDLQLSGKTVPVPLRDLHVSQHLKEEHGHPVIEVTVGTDFSQKVPRYGNIDGEFSITASAELDRAKKKRSRNPVPVDLELAMLAIALIAIGYARNPVLRPQAG